ncbi:hypothetical protein [Brevibacterium sp.]|uniref:hypothetical protein n=1 Tax=Brevibacterium sp. TaxID=1701 RepID=UPI002811405E|nr:hypothetical protein [Brevibacterium sp.]
MAFVDVHDQGLGVVLKLGQRLGIVTDGPELTEAAAECVCPIHERHEVVHSLLDTVTGLRGVHDLTADRGTEDVLCLQPGVETLPGSKLVDQCDRSDPQVGQPVLDGFSKKKSEPASIGRYLLGRIQGFMGALVGEDGPNDGDNQRQD